MARAGVEIVGDASKYERALKKSETATKRWATKIEAISAGTSVSRSGGILGGSSALLKGGGIALGAGIATQKIIEFTNAASDLNEQLSASRVIFRTSAGDIEDWSKTLAKSFGIAQTEGVAAAATFGSLFSAAGQSSAQAAKLSKVVVELAGDLASFKDTTVDEAVTALRSGLSGEIEPLRRYQVFLTEAAVAQEAMAETGKKSARQLTQGEKIIARYNLILEKTRLAQGDAARTAGSYANQQKRLHAETQNLKTSIGGVLLPVMLRFVGAANDNIDRAQKLGGAMQEGGEKTKDWTDRILELKKALHLPGPGPSGIIRLTDAARKAAEAVRTSDTPRGPRTGKSKPEPPPPPGASASLRNDWFDALVNRRLDRVQDAPLKAQVAALEKIRDTIVARIKVTNDITRKLNLEDQALQVTRDIQDVRDRIASDIAEKAAERAAQQERLFERGIGFLQLGIAKAEVTAGVEDDIAKIRKLNDALRRQIAEQGSTPGLLQQLFDNEQLIKSKQDQRRQTKIDWLQFGLEKAEATKGINDDISWQQKIIAAMKNRIKAEGRKLELVSELWREEQKLKGLLKQRPKFGPNNWITINGRKETLIPIGAPGSLAQMKRAGVSVTPPAALQFPKPGAGGGGSVISIGNLNLHGIQNVSGLEDELVKRSKQRPIPRRGR
jgi:hypothetical protein